METKEITKEEKRMILLESKLKERGYSYADEDGDFYFYDKKISDAAITQRMGFRKNSETAIIVYFGALPAFPVTSCYEISVLKDAVVTGNEEQRLLFQLTRL